jgi:hypothetical protein
MAIIVGNSKPDPNNGSPIEVTPELAAKVAAASSQAEVQALMHAAMEKQYAPDGTVTRSFAINGQTYTVTGANEAELLEQQNEIYRRVLTPEPKHQHVETADDRAIAARRAQLEAEYKLGRISLTDLITQSGVVEEVQNRQAEQGWAQATQEFLRSPEGMDYPGTSEVREWLGQWINEHGLLDTTDRLSALKQAYAALKQANTDAALANEEKDFKERLDAETDPRKIRDLLFEQNGWNPRAIYERQ